MQRNSYDTDEQFDLNSYSKNRKIKKRKSGEKKGLKVFLIVLCSVLAVLIAVGGCAWIYINSILNNAQYDDTDYSNIIDVNSESAEKFADYTNIALFGLDTRSDDDEGRSDAMIILTIDRVHNKIKLTSLARDSFVEIRNSLDKNEDGTYKDSRVKKEKLTHAWMYGKAALALDTINRNYKMDVTEYVSMNFYQFSEVIDYIGGVYVDVSKAEMSVMNRDYIPYLQKMGIKCEKVKKAGYQLLSGGQALAYSRDRYTGTDEERTARQREVLMAMFDRVKELEITKLPELAAMVLKECTTTLSSGEMIDIATWTLTSKPTFEQLSLPDDSCKAVGKTINTYWVWVYDLNYAANRLHDFILEEGDFSAGAVSNSSSK